MYVNLSVKVVIVSKGLSIEIQSVYVNPDVNKKRLQIQFKKCTSIQGSHTVEVKSTRIVGGGLTGKFSFI